MSKANFSVLVLDIFHVPCLCDKPSHDAEIGVMH